MVPSMQEPKTSWDLLQLTTTTHQWIKKAKACNVDIDDEIHRIIQTINDAPTMSSGHEKLTEVTIVQQFLLRGMYCSRIIRKVAEAEIRTLAAEGRADPRFLAQVNLIDDCERWALKQLPSEWRLGDPTGTEQIYYSLKEKVKEMIGKVASRL